MAYYRARYNSGYDKRYVYKIDGGTSFKNILFYISRGKEVSHTITRNNCFTPLRIGWLLNQKESSIIINSKYIKDFLEEELKKYT